MTPDKLFVLLVEAAETERRLPALNHKSVTFWPEIQAEWLAYPDEKTVTRLARANTAQITNYYLMIEIVLSVQSIEDRKLMWAVAHSAAFRQRGPAWLQIAKLLHCDRRTIKNRFFRLLVATTIQFNKRRNNDGNPIYSVG